MFSWLWKNEKEKKEFVEKRGFTIARRRRIVSPAPRPASASGKA